MTYNSHEQKYENQDEEAYEEAYESDGPEPLTKDEVAYIDSKIEEFKIPLKGIVTESQIEKKIIDCDFDGDKIDKWATTLMPRDNKYAGASEF